MAFVARWPFTCARCGEKHGELTEALFDDDDRIRAVDCKNATVADSNLAEFAVSTSDLRKTLDVCDSCYMVHSKGQEGCW